MIHNIHTKSKHGNKLQTIKKPSRSAAFTLIEMIVVICIMMILAGLLMGIAPYVWRSAKEAKARANLEKIHKALEEYMLANGSYPYVSGCELIYGADINTLTNQPPFNQLPPLLEKNVSLVDPWGNGYRYVCAQAGQQTYTLFSCGADGKSGPAPYDKDNIMTGK